MLKTKTFGTAAAYAAPECEILEVLENHVICASPDGNTESGSFVDDVVWG